MDGFGLRDDALRTEYAKTSGPVAFVDESFRRADGGERPFYLMSAAVIEQDAAARVREVLLDIAGSTYWHTTESFRSPWGREQIREMVDYLGSGDLWSLLVVQSRIRENDASLEIARRESLARLSHELTRGTGAHATRLIVMEKRRPGVEKSIDDRSISLLLANSIVPHDTTFYPASPAGEPLLWAPDVTAWALRRQLALGDAAWFTPLREAVTVLDVQTGRALNMKQPPEGRSMTPRVRPEVHPQAVVSPDTIRRPGPGGPA